MKPPNITHNGTNTTTTTTSSTVPTNIQSIESLYWHKRQMALGQPAQIFPCFIIVSVPSHPSRHCSGNSSDESDSDSESNSNSNSDNDDEEVTVEYLSAHGSPVNKRHTVMPKRLVPFHGSRDHDYDYEELGQLGWCERYMQEYIKQQKQQRRGGPGNGSASSAFGGELFDERVERKYLQQVLKVVKQREGYKTCHSGSSISGGKDHFEMDKDCHENDYEEHDDEDSGLEEPYTQAVMSKRHTSDSDDDEDDNNDNYDDERSSSCSSGSFQFRNRLKFKSNMTMVEQSNEPIRPGDVIEYYSPMFVFGSKQGRRVATVMSVNPNRNMVLKLSNNEYLPNDTKIKRIKILVTLDENVTGIDAIRSKSSNKSKRKMLVDHPGVFRRIRQFQLKKLKWPADYKISETETERLKSIMDKNMSKFKENVESIGFAPMDFMHRYGKKRNNSMSENCENDKNKIMVETNRTLENDRNGSHDSDDYDNHGDNTNHDDDDDSDCILKKLLHKSTKKLKHIHNTSSSSTATRKCYLSDSDENSMDCGITKPDDDVLEKENQLKLLGLSDDELPQSVFDINEKHANCKVDKTKQKVGEVTKSFHERFEDLVDKSDSESTNHDSMNFHSSLSPIDDKIQALERKFAKHGDKSCTYALSLDDDDDDDDDDDVSSSTISGRSDDTSIALQALIVVKNNKDKSPDNILSNASRSTMHHTTAKKVDDKKDRSGCEQQRFTKKSSNPIIPKSSLSISFRKYN